MNKKQTTIVIKDTDEIKNIVIQVNLRQNTTMVLSNYSSWDNLALIMEALSVTAQKCINEGMDQKHVRRAIDDYLAQAIKSYH